MKMRIVKDSPTGRKLAAILDKNTECRKAAKELAEAENWPIEIIRSSTDVAGGIMGIAFPEKPEGWKHVGTVDGKKFYYPAERRTASRDALAKLRALPKVSVFEWNAVLGWDGFLSRFGCIERPDCFLLAFPEKALQEAPAPTGPDFEEITNLQYEQLKAG